MAGGRGFGLLCWIPVACLLAIELYVARYDGWGAWAAAPLLLVPALVSLAFVVWGLVRMMTAGGAEGADGAEGSGGGSGWTGVIALVVAALPLAWLAVRRFVM